MSTKTNRIEATVDGMAEEARSLIEATADVSEEKVAAARDRLVAALNAAKETCATVQARATAGAKAADQVIRDRPYQAIGVAFGVGALLGFLLSRRS